jgi:hypothetical protein
MQLMMGDAAQRVAHCESFEHCLLPSARRRSSNITNQGKHKRSRSTSRGSPGSSKSHRFQNEGIPEAATALIAHQASISSQPLPLMRGNWAPSGCNQCQLPTRATSVAYLSRAHFAWIRDLCVGARPGRQALSWPCVVFAGKGW